MLAFTDDELTLAILPSDIIRSVLTMVKLEEIQSYRMVSQIWIILEVVTQNQLRRNQVLAGKNGNLGNLKKKTHFFFSRLVQDGIVTYSTI